MISPDRTRTDTYLLPGQQFCIGLPWEREQLPKHGLPAQPPAAAARSTLDDRSNVKDPFAGWEIGACRVVRRLSEGSARSLLAIRTEAEGARPVVLRRIELPDMLAREIDSHASWARRYRHPHLASVYGCEVTEEGIFWVTDLASGASLAELSDACRGSGQGVPVGLALAAVYEAALALAELHAPPGFAHGLVSDRGISVGFDGDAKLLDVGLFRCIARKSSWAEVLETAGPYLAPEQVLQGALPDPKTDVFSLGTVLYECLTGRRAPRTAAFDSRVKRLTDRYVPPSSVNVTVSKQLDEVVSRALTHDRSHRYATAGDFARALKDASAAFMWRRGLRAQFVGNLFEARRAHEEKLLAECRRTVAAPPSKRPSVPRLAVVPTGVRPPPLPKRARCRRRW